MLATAFVGLGSNVGDRLAMLRGAVQGFSRKKYAILGVSWVYESRAHTLSPEDDAPDYLNAVISVVTTVEPAQFLAVCQSLEKEAGRDREGEPRWAPRTLDIDLLVFSGHVVSTPGLTIPHPRLAERRFVLEPLCDIAPGLHVPPPFDALARDLLVRCTDPNIPVKIPESLL